MSLAGRKPIFINLSVFIVLEAVSLVCLLHNGELQKEWFGRGMTAVRVFFWKPVDNISGYFRLRSVNDSLAAENSRLFTSLRHIGDSIAHLPPVRINLRTRFSLLPASIVTATKGSQHNYVIIDRGSADGVKPDDGIVTSRGVVGIVYAVTEHFASAISFHSHDLSVSAKVGRKGVFGPLRWDGGDLQVASVSDLPLNAGIEPGDTVYTSGHSFFFPADIPLGTIVRRKPDNGNSLEFEVALFEHSGHNRTVYVASNLDKQELQELQKLEK